MRTSTMKNKGRKFQEQITLQELDVFRNYISKLLKLQ